MSEALAKTVGSRTPDPEATTAQPERSGPLAQPTEPAERSATVPEPAADRKPAGDAPAADPRANIASAADAQTSEDTTP